MAYPKTFFDLELQVFMSNGHLQVTTFNIEQLEKKSLRALIWTSPNIGSQDFETNFYFVPKSNSLDTNAYLMWAILLVSSYVKYEQNQRIFNTDQNFEWY